METTSIVSLPEQQVHLEHVFSGVCVKKAYKSSDGYKFLIEYANRKSLITRDLQGYFSYLSISESPNTNEETSHIYSVIEKLVWAQEQP